MIKHVVFFKLKDNSVESINKAKEVLLSMNGNVPMIKNLEIGIDFLKSERSYDICLQVEVEDKEQLTAYANDPYHCNVVKEYIFERILSSAVVDYEL